MKSNGARALTWRAIAWAIPVAVVLLLVWNRRDWLGAGLVISLPLIAEAARAVRDAFLAWLEALANLLAATLELVGAIIILLSLLAVAASLAIPRFGLEVLK